MPLLELPFAVESLLIALEFEAAIHLLVIKDFVQ